MTNNHALTVLCWTSPYVISTYLVTCTVGNWDKWGVTKTQNPSRSLTSWIIYVLETVQDFLIKLDIKPLMLLLEISIFSLNNDLLMLTKIMNNLVKDLKILSFKVIFKCLKLVESFQKKNSVKNIWLEDQLILMKFFENFDF